MKDLFGLDKVESAKELLRMLEPREGFYLAFSGGKDSIVIHELARLADVKFEAHYHITTVDPPELVQFIRKYYPNVITDRPSITMWRLIEKKLFPPTRIQRYCCRELKEVHGEGRIVITGVRAQESVKRRNRPLIDKCPTKAKVMVNLIVWWSEEEVWSFIKSRGLPYPSLYDHGYKRIGCIGCPMANKSRQRELDDYPKIKRAYLAAFGRMLEARKLRGLTNKKIGNTPEEVMAWWLQEPKLESDEEQPLFS